MNEKLNFVVFTQNNSWKIPQKLKSKPFKCLRHKSCQIIFCCMFLPLSGVIKVICVRVSVSTGGKTEGELDDQDNIYLVTYQPALLLLLLILHQSPEFFFCIYLVSSD